MAEELLASLEVVGQDGAGGRMDRHEPPPAELGAADRQNGLFKVHVAKLEVQRFGQAQARDAEQAEQAVEHPWPQRRRWPSRRQFQRRIQQAPDLFLGVQMRPGAGGSMRQQAHRRHLRAAVGGAAVTGKAAHEAKPSGPLGWLHRRTVAPTRAPSER